MVSSGACKLQEKCPPPGVSVRWPLGQWPRDMMWKLPRPDPDQIMINKLDDPPGVAVVVQEAAPGQGPVRDPHAVALRKITEPAELLARS
jgi:hypothetical protein